MYLEMIEIFVINDKVIRLIISGGKKYFVTMWQSCGNVQTACFFETKKMQLERGNTSATTCGFLISISGKE